MAIFSGSGIASLGSFSVGRATAAGATAFRKLIPPLRRNGFLASGAFPRGVTKITGLRYTTGATAHQIGVMRPFNWTTFAAVGAAAQAVVALTADPGLYATAANWKYTAFSGTPAVANNAIAAGDVCVYQCADGNFVLDTVASGTYAALTMTTNLPTGGVKAGGYFWFFGVIGDTDPNTREVNPQWTTTANGDETFPKDGAGEFTALHEGDPLVIYSPNTTAAGTLEFACGYYGRW